MSHAVGTQGFKPIARLPEHLINQIAAGEVVERPASIVKELVENALDAGATRVDISLKSGGLEEIQILDNGRGIPGTEIPVAVERHTTSKLTDFKDLDSLSTYGFRGEALSSIASVAELTLRSRTHESPNGFQISVVHGAVSELVPTASPVGTSVTVRGLFDRLPARQKFMRTPATEFSHSARTVREIAVGNPGTGFFLHHGGKLVHAYSPGSRKTRVMEALKPTWDPLHIIEENPDARLEAFLSPPSWIADRGELLIYVNGRSVRAKTVSGLLRNIYMSALGPHHEPCGVISLDLRHDWVDVNVHPQKLEVRLLKQESLFQWIGAAVRKALQRVESDPGRGGGSPPFSYRHIPDAPSPRWHDRRLGPDRRPRPATLPVQTTLPQSPAVRFLVQAHGYLICEDDDNLILIDPGALHSRLLYERLKRRATTGEWKSQDLLVPLIVTIPSEQRDRFETLEPGFEQIGFRIDAFGEREIAVKSIPADLKENEVPGLIESCLKNALEFGIPVEASHEAILEKLLQSVASHGAARRAGPLALFEINELLAEWEKAGPEVRSSRGFPVTLKLPWTILSKKFLDPEF